MPLRTLTDKKIAYSVWLMPDGTARTIREDVAGHLRWVADGAKDEKLSRPAAGAILVRTACPFALDTPDGWPARGDSWEIPDPANPGRKKLVVANSADPSFQCSFEAASDPGRLGVSNVEITTIDGMRNWEEYQNYDLGNLPPAKTVSVVVDVDTVVRPNHKSVTYDASASTSVFNDSPVTLGFAFGLGANANRYIAALVSGGAYLTETLSIAWNGAALAQRINQAGTVAAKRSEYWDRVAPDAGSHNAVFTFDAGFQYGVIGLVSAYGVDQTNPRSASNSGDWTNFFVDPALTLAGGAAGELAISLFTVTYTDAPTTTDAAWTQLWNFTADGLYAHGAAARIAGAASVTRTDAPPCEAATLIVSLKAAASGVNSSFFLFG